METCASNPRLSAPNLSPATVNPFLARLSDRALSEHRDEILFTEVDTCFNSLIGCVGV